jgi:hypothetical protein
MGWQRHTVARLDLRSAEEKARARHCVGEDGSRPRWFS